VTPQVPAGPPPPVAREQQPGDEDAIEALLRGAFADVRSGPSDANDERVRSRGFVAVVSDTIPGTDMSGVTNGHVVGYVGVQAAGDSSDVLVLDPIAVDPGEQHKGVGTYLVQFAVEVLWDTHAASALVAKDDAPFLRTFGFRPTDDGGSMVLPLRGPR
jgi:predicted N-acetyltransferase YhbS